MARAYRFTIIRLPASSLEDAHEMIGRLSGIGLPRQSMKVTPHEDERYHVAVHTHEGNREAIMRAVQGLTGRGMASAAVAGTVLGGVALLGAGLWAMWRNSKRVQDFFGQAQDQLRSSLRVGDQDRATLESSRGDRKVTDRSGRVEHSEQPFAPQGGTTLGGGGHTGAATLGQSGAGSGLAGTAGQAGAPKQPADTEPADEAVRAGTAGSVHAIS